MKPLMLVKIPQGTDVDECIEFAEDFYKNHESLYTDYDIIIYKDLDIKVYYPSKPISFYYQKIKTWLILKIMKKKKF